jgi:hypothetical protein
MTGDDILKLAGDLLARDIRSPSEALCRNVVGRSYYGAFHLALGLMADLGLPEPPGHKGPVHWLIGSGEQNAAKAGRSLDALYEARRRADYKLHLQRAIDESRDLQFVKSQVELANETKLLLSSCAAEPARSQVLAGIQAFLQRQAGQARNS